MIEVSFFPILFAGITAMLIAFAWYDPRVFGSAWTRMTNLSPEAVEHGKKTMTYRAPIGLMASMLVAYVMNYFGIAWGVYDVIGAIELGFWSWAGFTLPVLLGVVLWEQKPFKLFLINAGYWLVTFIAMAIVLLLA